MPRPAVTVVALALAGLVVGCGDHGAAGTPAGAVRSYNDAVAGGDGQRACDLLDPSAQAELRRSAQGQARSSCRQVVEALAAFYDDATKERLRAARVAVAQQSDRAWARFTSPVAFGGPQRAATYELRRAGDRWKITSLGAADPGTGGP